MKGREIRFEVIMASMTRPAAPDRWEAGRRKGCFTLRDEGQGGGEGQTGSEKAKDSSPTASGEIRRTRLAAIPKGPVWVRDFSGYRLKRPPGRTTDGQPLNQWAQLKGADVASHWWLLGVISSQ